MSVSLPWVQVVAQLRSENTELRDEITTLKRENARLSDQVRELGRDLHMLTGVAATQT